MSYFLRSFESCLLWLFLCKEESVSPKEVQEVNHKGHKGGLMDNSFHLN